MLAYKRLTAGMAAALLLTAALTGCGGVQQPSASSVKAPVVAEKDKAVPMLPENPAPQPQGPVPLPPMQGGTSGTNPTSVGTAPPASMAMTFTTLQKGAYSGLTDRKVVLVTDEAAWKSNWQQISARQVPAPDAPALDFAGQSLIVASLGEKMTGGYGVEVTGVHMVDGKLQVTVKETKPGPGQMVTEALTQPYQIVRIPKVPAGTTVEVVWE